MCARIPTYNDLRLMQGLSNLKQINSATTDTENNKECTQKSGSHTVREFLKFDSLSDSKTNAEESKMDNDRILKELSASNTSKSLNNDYKTSVCTKFDKKEEFTSKPRKAMFSDEEPIVCGDLENSIPNQSLNQEKSNNYGKKQSTISGIKSKRPTNNLINAKEESEKLKEQCAQQ